MTDLDMEALGEWGLELSDDNEQALIQAVAHEIEYRDVVSLSGPTTSISGKIPDWLEHMIQLAVVAKGLPWRTIPSLVRNSIYFFLKALKYLELTNDPKWRRAMLKANMNDLLSEAKDKEETLRKSGSDLREILTTYVRMGNMTRATNALVAFWDQAKELPEDERQGYQMLFADVPVVKYVAGMCEGRLPEYLVPSEEEMATIAVEDFQVDVEERTPVEKRVKTPEEIRKEHAEYVKKWRARRAADSQG